MSPFGFGPLRWRHGRRVPCDECAGSGQVAPDPADGREDVEPARREVARLPRDNYPDFGPTLAAEKLAERDGIVVSRETIRRMQTELALHRPKRRRAKRVFRLRERRARFGELVQIDGSPHDWFEGRGRRCMPIVFIDDATSRLTALRFAPVESGKVYLDTLRDRVPAHGCPLAFYSDRHGIFRVNAKDARSGDGKTEFGRVVERLEIDPINAPTPQAKGRVERANQTLRDRPIEEMRLRNITSMEQVYPVHARIRKFLGEMTRKLSDTSSQ